MKIYSHKEYKSEKIEFVGQANITEDSFRYLGIENKNIFFNIPRDEVERYWELSKD